MNKFPPELAARFAAFKYANYGGRMSHYETLAKTGQAPETLVIACIDSRVTPENLFSAQPGEILVARNIANLVPPREEIKSNDERHGVSAIVEFAVVNLAVKNIVVLGHSQCGGIRACLHHDPLSGKKASFVSSWVSILEEPRKKILTCTAANDEDVMAHNLERAGIQKSLENLRSFPFVTAAENNGTLSLFGAHFDIAKGTLSLLDETDGTFQPLTMDLVAQGLTGTI